MEDSALIEVDDVFSQPEKRSQAFWDAMIALGGTPEMAAPHVPEMTEREIAGEMAEARGRAAAVVSIRPFCHRGSGVPGGPQPMRSNWCAIHA